MRGADNLTIDHGWLNQVSDEASTGLVYLNARYYDAQASRFVSPDPLMNPADPRTLDAYRYAENNPVTFTDANGMCAVGGWKYVGGVLEAPCNVTNGNSPRYVGGPEGNGPARLQPRRLRLGVDGGRTREEPGLREGVEREEAEAGHRVPSRWHRRLRSS